MTQPLTNTEVAQAAERLEQAIFEVKRVIVGQDRVVERLLVCVLAHGHTLIEGVPGLAKTLAAETMALAEVIAAKLPAAVRMGKRAFHAQTRLGLGDAYAATGAVMCENMMRADTAEGIQAFLEKRPPDWS